MKVNKDIKIAILLFSQLKDKQSNREIINLSSWYAKPEYRGIEAINFARKLCIKLDHCVLTNYTASKEAATIFKSLGFLPMEVGRLTFGLSRKFPYMEFFDKKRTKIFEPTKVAINKNYEPEFISIKESSKANHAKKIQYTITQEKFFFFTLRSIHFYLEEENHQTISPLIFIKYAILQRAVRIVIYSPLISAYDDQGNWLIKSNGSNRKYVFPYKSELSVI